MMQLKTPYFPFCLYICLKLLCRQYKAPCIKFSYITSHPVEFSYTYVSSHSVDSHIESSVTLQVK